jgi:hypothetical protein
MQLILSHLPHIIPAIVGLAFLARFTWYMKSLPPADLTDEELANWHASRKQGGGGTSDI